jgi:hypothetical protein
MVLPAHSEPRPLSQFRNHFSQTVGVLGRLISPSQGRYLNIGLQKQNKRIHTPNIHVLCGIRTHDPSVRASEDSSCLRPRGYCDRHRNTDGLVKYEGDSVNRSKMDTKRKTCVIRTWKNIYFSTYPPPTLKILSHRFTNASKPAV